MKKPCPFCCNPNAPENDTGEACCFCDYEGEITIGKNGMFINLEQYNKVYFASNHKNRLDELHGRNDSKPVLCDTTLNTILISCKERLKILEERKQTNATLGRINEIQMIIVYLQMKILDNIV